MQKITTNNNSLTESEIKVCADGQTCTFEVVKLCM